MKRSIWTTWWLLGALWLGACEENLGAREVPLGGASVGSAGVAGSAGGASAAGNGPSSAGVAGQGAAPGAGGTSGAAGVAVNAGAGGAATAGGGGGGAPAGGASGGGGASAQGGGAGAAGAKPGPKKVPDFQGLSMRCKLINGKHLDDPTANQTHWRANLRGTDLGIPVRHGDDLFVFFGDTAGAVNIWPLGPESLPDAVGYSALPYAEVAKDPGVLCQNLRFLLTGGKSGDVEGDFAAVSMTPPKGHSVSEFIHNPAGPRGQGVFPNLPGDFEVPSGVFSHLGSIYVFYTTINLEPFEMRGSYLARWPSPSTAGKPDLQVLHHVDQRFDTNGPLRGDFIQVAPLVSGNQLYVFGTGKYRASPVHLARKPLAKLAEEGGFQRYDAAKKQWVAPDAPGAPIVASPHVGELSVQYFAAIDRYVMLDQEVSAGNRVVARFADAPEGPWSEAVTVAQMEDPAFALQYCCIPGGNCDGARLMHCDKAGFYAPYLLPDLITHPDGSFTLSFFLSTWDPYNVALMGATFR